MPDVFLTGGSGFVGGALLAELRSRGRTVRALARTRTASEMIGATGATAVMGDLFDEAALMTGMQDVTTVFHVAGVNEMCSRDPSEMLRVNVDGAVAVIEAAAKAGVSRVVLTSSAASLGEAQGTVGDEGSVHRGSYLSHYERSKHLGEQAAFASAAELGVDLVAVLPSSVQGPGRTGGTARLLIGYLRGALRVAVDTTVSIVYVDDCVEGHLLAESAGAPGERYVLSGASLEMSAALEQLRRLGAPDRRVWMIPGFLARTLAWPTLWWGRLTRKEPLTCPESIRTALHGHRYDGSRATRRLGLHYTPISQALGQTAAWYRHVGLID